MSFKYTLTIQLGKKIKNYKKKEGMYFLIENIKNGKNI